MPVSPHLVREERALERAGEVHDVFHFAFHFAAEIRQPIERPLFLRHSGRLGRGSRMARSSSACMSSFVARLLLYPPLSSFSNRHSVTTRSQLRSPASRISFGGTLEPKNRTVSINAISLSCILRLPKTRAPSSSSSHSTIDHSFCGPAYRTRHFIASLSLSSRVR